MPNRESNVLTELRNGEKVEKPVFCGKSGKLKFVKDCRISMNDSSVYYENVTVKKNNNQKYNI